MVSVFFATNRAPLEKGNEDIFDNETRPGNAQQLMFGEAKIDLTAETAGRAKNRLADEKGVNSVTIFKKGEDRQRGRAAGTAELAKALKASIAKGNELLIYLHGYDTNFREAVWYGGQIKLQFNRLLKKQRQSALDLGGQIGEAFEVLVFSWPSAGKALAYPFEFKQITRKGWHLGLTGLLDQLPGLLGQEDDSQGLDNLENMRPADLLAAVESGGLTPPGRVHLMAQSMGARVLGQGFDTYCSRFASLAELSPLFQTVLLTGADIDDDAFEQGGPLFRLPLATDRIAVYYNQQDRLGFLSGIIWGKGRMSRRGLADPAAAPRAVEIDVSDVIGSGASGSSGKDPDPFGHYYARMNEHVIADILHLLADVPPKHIPKRTPDGYRNAFALTTE